MRLEVDTSSINLFTCILKRLGVENSRFGFERNIYRLLTFYKLFIDLLDVVFSGYLIQTGVQANTQYLTLCKIIQDILSNEGFESVREYPWRPFDNILSFDPDYPEGDWEYGGRQKCLDFLSHIQEIHIKHGDKRFELDETDSDQISQIKSYIDVYSKQKKISETRWLKKIEEISKKDKENTENQGVISQEVKVFLSYSTKDKEQAGIFKQNLEKYGLDVFLAHEDIRPSVEWQDEIVKTIKECQIFIPLFSSNFRSSKWTDQETGIAFSLGKKVIPINLDETVPYGFVGRYQSLKCKENIYESCMQIFEIILEDPLNSGIIDNLIKNFLNSGSFSEANESAQILMKLGNFNKTQINDIIYGFMINGQVYDATQGRKFVLKLVEQYRDEINLQLFEYFIKFQANRYIVFEPFWNNEKNIKEIYVNHILNERKGLDRDTLDRLIDEEKLKHSFSTFEAIQKVYEKLDLSF